MVKKAPVSKKTKYTLADLLPQIGEMTVVHPGVGELDCKIRLQGMHVQAVKNKALQALSWLQKNDKNQTPEELVAQVQKVEEISGESAAAAIVGWTNDEVMGGGYSPEYASALMARSDMGWLRDQINTFVGKQSNFFRSADS